MRILDAFCGAGGAAMGYHRAGFDEIVGVDIKPQPRYPFRFVLGDAIEYIKAHGHEFDAIHASPPCQAYIRSGMVAKDGRHPQMIEPTRAALWSRPLYSVIENVPGAPIRGDVMLCGSMFGLMVRRHRYFELSVPFTALAMSCNHNGPITGVYGHPHGKGGAWRNGNRPMLPSDVVTWSRALGIDWMTGNELSQAIPPAYTEFIGKQLIQAIRCS